MSTSDIDPEVRAAIVREHYREIGRKGGRATAAQRGLEWYQEIGRKGGSRPKPRGPRVSQKSAHGEQRVEHPYE